MSDLAEFLLARIDEDEVAAAKVDGRRWRVAGHPADSWIVQSDAGPVVYNEGAPTEEEAAHIAHWDPARVLAECDAKRRTIELHIASAADGHICPSGRGAGTLWSFQDDPACDTLRLLAAPYVEHPSFDESWKL